MTDEILLTGGAGFIGSSVLDALLEKGIPVTVIDNFNDFYDPRIKEKNIEEALQNKLFTLHRIDICNRNQVREVVGSKKWRAIVHLAAWAGVTPSIAKPFLYNRVNIGGTLNLLDAAKENNVPEFIFASSSSVYGKNDSIPFKETDIVTKPLCPYAATKLAGEHLLYTYHSLYGYKAVALRFFTVYGPRQRPEMAIHKFIRKILLGEEITLYANGEMERDYTYIDDIVKGVLGAIDLKCEYEVFNLGESCTTSTKNLVEMLEDILKRKAKVKLAPARQGECMVTYSDVSKAKKFLKYKPQTDMETGLQKAVKWYASQDLPGSHSI